MPAAAGYFAWGCFRYFCLGARSACSGALARRLAPHPPGDALDHLGVVAAENLLGGVTEMRRDHHIVELAEGVVDRQRLDREHGDAGAAGRLLLQGLPQRRPTHY